MEGYHDKNHFLFDARRKIDHVIHDHVTRKHEFIADPKKNFARKRTENMTIKSTFLTPKVSANDTLRRTMLS
jgi:hypothetical protein